MIYAKCEGCQTEQEVRFLTLPDGWLRIFINAQLQDGPKVRSLKAHPDGEFSFDLCPGCAAVAGNPLESCRVALATKFERMDDGD